MATFKPSFYKTPLKEEDNFEKVLLDLLESEDEELSHHSCCTSEYESDGSVHFKNLPSFNNRTVKLASKPLGESLLGMDWEEFFRSAFMEYDTKFNCFRCLECNAFILDVDGRSYAAKTLKIHHRIAHKNHYAAKLYTLDDFKEYYNILTTKAFYSDFNRQLFHHGMPPVEKMPILTMSYRCGECEFYSTKQGIVGHFISKHQLVGRYFKGSYDVQEPFVNNRHRLKVAIQTNALDLSEETLMQMNGKVIVETAHTTTDTLSVVKAEQLGEPSREAGINRSANFKSSSENTALSAKLAITPKGATYSSRRSNISSYIDAEPNYIKPENIKLLALAKRATYTPNRTKSSLLKQPPSLEVNTNVSASSKFMPSAVVSEKPTMKLASFTPNATKGATYNPYRRSEANENIKKATFNPEWTEKAFLIPKTTGEEVINGNNRASYSPGVSRGAVYKFNDEKQSTASKKPVSDNSRTRSLASMEVPAKVGPTLKIVKESQTPLTLTPKRIHRSSIPRTKGAFYMTRKSLPNAISKKRTGPQSKSAKLSETNSNTQKVAAIKTTKPKVTAPKRPDIPLINRDQPDNTRPHVKLIPAGKTSIVDAGDCDEDDDLSHFLGA